jgi:phosphate starvation-inducible PhoH-like protein
VKFMNLTSADVVRHRLVGNIVDAYERWDATRQPASGGPGAGAPVRTSRPRRQGS